MDPDSQQKDLQLEDLLAFYPDPMTPGIQTIISNKREFAELSSSPTEKIPAPGQYYKHQEFIGRLMTFTDRLLLMHQTGTGKTRAFIRVAEYYKNLMLIGNSPIRKIFILVKGPSLKREIRDQILCSDATGFFMTDAIRNATTEESRRKAISKSISKWYTVMTYYSFASLFGSYEKVQDLEPDGTPKVHKSGRKKDEPIYKRVVSDFNPVNLIEEYSNSLIIVDEAHNLRIDPDLDGNKKEEEFVYKQINRAFHLIQKSKIILSTATPMINDPAEIAPLMNLILPETEQFQKNKNGSYGFNFATVTTKEIEKYFRGRVSYVRALDTGAIIEFQGTQTFKNRSQNSTDTDGNPITVTSQIIAYRTDMKSEEIEEPEGHKEHEEPEGIKKPAAKVSLKPAAKPTAKSVAKASAKSSVKVSAKHATKTVAKMIGQNHWYIDTVDLNKEVKQIEDVQTSTFYINARRAALFTFPDGSYDDQGFNNYVTKEGDDYEANAELKGYLEDEEDLKLLSCKMAEIVRLCVSEKGNCFIYTDYVNIGVHLMGLVFKHNTLPVFGTTKQKFEKFIGDKPFYSDNADAKLCGGRSVKGRRLNFQPGLRYAILTSKTPENYAINIMDAFNSYENRNGDYIKIFIGSPTARDGINLLNVRQVHIASAGWTPSATHQAISRGHRATSHVEIINDQIESYVDEKYQKLPAKKKTEHNSDELKSDIRLHLPKLVEEDIDIQLPKSLEQEIERQYQDEIKKQYYDEIERQYQQSKGNHPKISEEELKFQLMSKIPEIKFKSQLKTSEAKIKSQLRSKMTPEFREKIREKISLDLDPRKIRLKVYKHYAVADYKDKDGKTRAHSIDMQMYNLSEQKEIAIKRMERILKICSIDCQVHRQRNNREGDIAGSPTCDYMDCKYPCFDKLAPGLVDPKFLDDTTYDVYYSQPIIENIKEQIIKYFRVNFQTTFSKLHADILRPQNGPLKPRYVDIAISQLINEKYAIYNRYGFRSYLVEENNLIFLTREYPSTSTKSQGAGYYTQFLSAYQIKPISKILSDDQKEEEEALLEILKEMDPEDPEFGKSIDVLSPDSKIILVESIIKGKFLEEETGFTDEQIEKIYQKFEDMIFVLREPVTALKKISKEFTVTGNRRRGRPPNNGNKPKILKLKGDEIGALKFETKSPYVYLHNLDSFRNEGVAFASTAKYNKVEGNLRILQPAKEKEWRNLQTYEIPIYNAYLQKMRENRLNKYEKMGIYGFVLAGDNKFRIRDKENEIDTKDKADIRTYRRGLQESSWKIPELYRLIYKLGIPPPPDTPNITINKKNKDDVIREIKSRGIKVDDTMDNDDLRLLWRWSTKNLDASTLRAEVHQFLEDNDRVYYEYKPEREID